MTKRTWEKWAERVREWRTSGVPAEEFAAGKDYEASTLRWAASQLKDNPKIVPSTMTAAHAKTKRGDRPKEKSPLPASVTPRFLPVRTQSSVAMPADVIIEVGGARIRVSRGADLALVGDVVRALQGVAQ